MKQLYTLFTVSLTILAFSVMSASCGRGKKDTTASAVQSDSAQTAEMVSPIAGDTAFYLTRDSIGPIHVGDKISDLPVAVANLYDNMLITETPDAVAYSFLLSDIPQFTVYDFMNGKVDIIALEANSHGVSTPQGTLRVGDEFTRVLALPGVMAEWEAIDDTGIWYWKYEGLFFGIDETNISENLGDAICDGHNPPRAALFSPEVKIGYIATGLPF